MSIERHVHVGPFLVCKRPEKELVIKRYSCINQSCSRFEKPQARTDQFCVECGLRLETWETKHSERRSKAWEAVEAVKEVLRAPGSGQGGICVDEDIFTANVRTNVFSSEYIDYQNAPASFSFKDNLVAEEKKTFCEIFAAEIAVIEELYGKENCSVEWGVLLWVD